MKKLTKNLPIIFGLILIASLAMAQTFPPAHNAGPFPTGTEEVREDAPCDVNLADGLGTLHEYTAYRGTPTVDGNVDTDPVWNQIPWTALDSYNNGSSTCYFFDDGCGDDDTYGGQEDITAWFKILWDDENVYFALKKRDNEYQSNADHAEDLGNIWQDDAYQIVLDTNDPLNNDGSGVSSECGLVYLDYTDTGFNVWRGGLELADGDGTSGIPAADGKAFFANMVEHDNYYEETMELAFVKWDEIVADEAQLFSIMANDPDWEHTVKALQWGGGGIFSPKSTDHYTSIVYSSSNPPATDFPPVHAMGPFPRGTEEVREDAPCDVNLADGLGTLHEYTAYYGTPTVDGDLNDEVWNSIPWTVMDSYNNGSSTCYFFDDGCGDDDTYSGHEDITAWFKILWDENNVYFALKKRDNEYQSNADHAEDLGNIWQDDAYQIVLDTNDPLNNDGSGVSSECGLVYLDYTDTGFNVWRGPLELADGDGTSGIPAADGKAFFANMVEHDDYYEETMELAFVKWDEIVADEAQLFSIMANDPDWEHTVKALQWGGGGIFSPKSTDHYASIVYSSENALTGAAVAQRTPAQPAEFALEQNYPNPFNPTTTISYSLAQNQEVALVVYDVLGNKVRTLVSGVRTAGEHRVQWDGTDAYGQTVSSGVYLYNLTIGDRVERRKMMFLK